MSSFQNLPTELVDNVVLYLETPQDLLHVALTCKALYEMIVPTYRLHFAGISGSLSETPSIFWQGLSNSPRLRSTIRHLEFCEGYLFYSRKFTNIRPFNGLRIDETFLEFPKLTGSIWRYTLRARTDFDKLFRCLSDFHRCHSVTVYEKLSLEECGDLLAYISTCLSDILQTLVIHIFLDDRDVFLPKCVLSDCSFGRMVTFSLDIRDSEDFLNEKISVMLDSLVFTCVTLVDFTLRLDHIDSNLFNYFHLMKDANWPLLRKMRLGGDLRLFDPQDEGADVYISFLERHPRLESLHLKFADLEGNAPAASEPFRAELPSHVLPQLRSLSVDFSIHPGILPRLTYISHLQVFSAETYPLATSLRSCVLDVTSDSIIQDIAEAFPNLERLCLMLGPCRGTCEDECFCIDFYNPVEIERFRNLSHLGIFSQGYPEIASSVIMDLLQSLLGLLPTLSHAYVDDLDDPDLPIQYRVAKESDTIVSLTSSIEPLDPDWSDELFYRMMDRDLC